MMNGFHRLRLTRGACAIALTLSGSAFAQIDCTNDDDCPDTECGGQVCQWVDADTHTCMPAGSKPAGEDGWCTTDDDCKCMALGATCEAIYCSFTTPDDAPAGTGGGTSGSGGGTSGSGGTTSGTGGSAGSAPADEDDGGCALTPNASRGAASAFGVASLLLALGALRRRR
jgi:hypothetical protein